MSEGGGCEAALTARTGCGLDGLMECGELPHGKTYLVKMNRTVYKSYVRPAILH